MSSRERQHAEALSSVASRPQPAIFPEFRNALARPVTLYYMNNDGVEKKMATMQAGETRPPNSWSVYRGSGCWIAVDDGGVELLRVSSDTILQQGFQVGGASASQNEAWVPPTRGDEVYAARDDAARGGVLRKDFGKGVLMTPSICRSMLECYARGPGPPLPYPLSHLLVSTATDRSVPTMGILALADVAVDGIEGMLACDIYLAHAFKEVSRQLRGTLDAAILVTHTGTPPNLVDKLAPWLRYIGPSCTIQLACIHDLDVVLADSVAAEASVLVVCAASVEVMSRATAVPELLRDICGAEVAATHGLAQHLCAHERHVCCSEPAAVLFMPNQAPTEISEFDHVQIGQAGLLEYDCSRTAPGWRFLAPWRERHCPATCGQRRSAGAAADGIPGSACRHVSDGLRWPFCDATSPPEDGRDRCGVGFDGQLAFAAFYSQWAPSPVPCIERPLRMHGVWIPRCTRSQSKGTLIFCNGLTVHHGPGGIISEHEGAAFGPQCLWSALLGLSVPTVTPDRNRFRECVEPLPASISGFRCHW